MATDKKPKDFRVIIGGGGIAGLTLANCLQHANIDYVLLERRDVVNPDVGASIGLAPNGARILDQLGCYEDIEDFGPPFTEIADHFPDGNYIHAKNDSPTLVAKRFGYGLAFIDRQFVLQVLYEHIWDKSKVLVGKKVATVDQNPNGVTVHCEDGTQYFGDVIAGADGIYSKTREAMWRMADAADPGAIPQEDKDVIFTDYQCLYGIADGVDGMDLGCCDITMNKDVSTLIVTGKNKHIWFFLTKKYDKRYKYGERPSHYSKEEAEKYAEASLDLGVMPNKSVTFDDIWKKRKSFTLVPVEEGIFKVWTWGRFACLGDSIHKMTPQGGQGGNSAIESAASLTNELVMLLEETNGAKPTYEQIKKSLSQFQARLNARISAITQTSTDVTRIHTQRSVVEKILVKYVVPQMGDYLFDMLSDMFIGAEMLEYLPPPPASFLATMPFNHSFGLGRHESKSRRALLALPILAISAVMINAMGMVDPIYPVFESIFKNGQFEWEGVSAPIIREFYKVPFFDKTFAPITIFFAQLQFYTDPRAYWQSLTFISDYAGMYAVFLLESCRRNNNLTIFQIPVFLGYYAQIFTIGILGPVYFYLYYVFSPIEKFAGLDLRLTNRQYSLAVLPCLLLLYYIPHFLSYFHPSLEARHWWDWIWQLYPVWVSVSMYVLGKTVMPNTMQYDRVYAVNRDMPILRTTVAVIAIISTGAYWYTLATAGLSIREIFVPEYFLNKPQEADVAIRTILQYDQICSFSAGLLWLAYLFSDLKSAGMCDYSWLSIVSTAVATGAVFGPGTLFLVGWITREEILATRRHKDAMTEENWRHKKVTNGIFMENKKEK